ncbi:MAG: hypothetical protein FWE83_08465 [Oscillospiraceae bacterium]|nr:hypothetical protein [Oscillospiraceae bacterium]
MSPYNVGQGDQTGADRGTVHLSWQELSDRGRQGDGSSVLAGAFRQGRQGDGSSVLAGAFQVKTDEPSPCLTLSLSIIHL